MKINTLRELYASLLRSQPEYEYRRRAPKDRMQASVCATTRSRTGSPSEQEHQLRIRLGFRASVGDQLCGRPEARRQRLAEESQKLRCLLRVHRLLRSIVLSWPEPSSEATVRRSAEEAERGGSSETSSMEHATRNSNSRSCTARP